MNWHKDNENKLLQLNSQLTAETQARYPAVLEAVLTKNLTRLESLQEKFPEDLRPHVQPLINNLRQLPEKLYSITCPGLSHVMVSAVSKAEAHEVVFGYVKAFYPRRNWKPENVTVMEAGK